MMSVNLTCQCQGFARSRVNLLLVAVMRTASGTSAASICERQRLRHGRIPHVYRTVTGLQSYLAPLPGEITRVMPTVKRTDGA
jgi:hypothetical protein